MDKESGKGSELQVMVSEGLMEASSWLVTTLATSHGVICRDVPLEDPLALIIDGHTGVVLLAPSMASSRDALKKVVKAMTKLAFKFRTIWVLNLQETGQGQGQGQGGDTGFVQGLYQSLSQFPCRVTHRHCTNENLAAQIAAVCYDAAMEATLHSVDTAAYVSRPVFEALDRGAALNSNVYGGGNDSEPSGAVTSGAATSVAGPQKQTLPVLYQHCQFLQLLPTINFYVAAELLLRWTLPELASLTAAQVLRGAHLQLQYDPALQDMCALLQRHIGIRVKQRVDIPPATVSPEDASRKAQSSNLAACASDIRHDWYTATGAAVRNRRQT